MLKLRELDIVDGNLREMISSLEREISKWKSDFESREKQLSSLNPLLNLKRDESDIDKLRKAI